MHSYPCTDVNPLQQTIEPPAALDTSSARAYLNGDGVGHETHLSMFIVVMKGEYDALLPWPFRHKVSLVLLDQGHHKHIVQTFKPTPDLPSFMRPQSEMNDPRYVKDDVMFIKCIVDVSSVFAP